MRRRRRIRRLALVAAGVAAIAWWGRTTLGPDGPGAASSDAAVDARNGSAQRATGGDRGRGGARGAAGDRTAAETGDPLRDRFRDVGADERPGEQEGPTADRDPGAAVVPIALAPLRGSRADATLSLAGFDPFGPRELLAWRIANGKFAIVAHGQSDRDGNLTFPDLVAPRNGLEIVVTAIDGVPGLPGASESRFWAARDPVAPAASVVESDATAHRIRITPRESSGVVVLADDYGVELARIPVRSSPIASTRDFDLTLTSNPVETHVYLAHEFEDGRASEWETVVLPGVEAVEADGAEADDFE